MEDKYIRIREDLYKKLETLAGKEKRSIKKQLEVLLEQAL